MLDALSECGPGTILQRGIKKDEGYYYFVDKEGDVSRVKIAAIEDEIWQDSLLCDDYIAFYVYQYQTLRFDLNLPCPTNEMLERGEVEKLKVEEAEKLRKERLRRKARQELFAEEYKDIPEDEKIRYIPDEVKEFVWRRDQAKCIKCGSRKNLEFDHIIPFSKSGFNLA